jgi:hypothetical protein
MIKDSTLTRWASAIFLAGAIACVHGHAQQSGQREVREYPAEAGRQSPLEVVSVRVKGEPVGPGHRFAGGDDWLSGLTFRVKNVSDAPISFVDIRLRFPTPAGDKRESVGLLGMLSYGCYPGGRCYPDAAGSHKEIMPGQAQDIELSEHSYQGLMVSLARLGVQLPVESAQYEIDSVFFAADTMWSRGLLMKRDPVEPNKFKTVGRYVLTKTPE